MVAPAKAQVSSRKAASSGGTEYGRMVKVSEEQKAFMPAWVESSKTPIVSLWRKVEWSHVEDAKTAFGIPATPVLTKAFLEALNEYTVFATDLSGLPDVLFYPERIRVGTVLDTGNGTISVVAHENAPVQTIADEWEMAKQRVRRGEDIGAPYVPALLTNLGPYGISGVHGPPPGMPTCFATCAPSLEPVQRNEEQVEHRRRFPAILEFDHRIANGAEAGHFLRVFEESLEQMAHGSEP